MSMIKMFDGINSVWKKTKLFLKMCGKKKVGGFCAASQLR